MEVPAGQNLIKKKIVNKNMQDAKFLHVREVFKGYKIVNIYIYIYIYIYFK